MNCTKRAMSICLNGVSTGWYTASNAHSMFFGRCFCEIGRPPYPYIPAGVQLTTASHAEVSTDFVAVATPGTNKLTSSASFTAFVFSLSNKVIADAPSLMSAKQMDRPTPPAPINNTCPVGNASRAPENLQKPCIIGVKSSNVSAVEADCVH